MRLAVLFSGGKDSVQCVEWGLANGHDVAVLVTIKSRNPESYMFHVPNVEWTHLQAEALGIPQIVQETEGVKEEELADMKRALQTAKARYGIEGVLSGAILSNYQSSRIEKVCAELGLDSAAPLWRRPPTEMLQEMVAKGYKVMMSAVAAGGLGPEWLGRVLDDAAIEELTDLHHTCYVCTGGEGGEFETFVLDGPIFRKRIAVRSGQPRWDGKAGVFDITDAALEDKLA